MLKYFWCTIFISVVIALIASLDVEAACLCVGVSICMLFPFFVIFPTMNELIVCYCIGCLPLVLSVCSTRVFCANNFFK